MTRKAKVMAKKRVIKKTLGRPTTYTQALVTMAWAYIKNYKTKHGHEFPSVVGLCSVVNRSRSTLYRWSDEHSDIYQKEFKDILAKLNEEQELVLLNNGINGKFNSNITKLVLGKHNYHEKIDTENTANISVTIEKADAGTL